MLISNTPASKAVEASDCSKSKFCLNVSCAPALYMMDGVSRRLSKRLAGSTEYTELGRLSATGVGVPEAEVTQNGKPPPLIPCVAIQSGGSIGGVTPSKFSLKTGGQDAVAVAVGVAVGVGLGDPIGPQKGVGEAVGVGLGVGVAPARLNAPIRNRQPLTLVVGMYSLTYQKSRSLLGSTVISV